MVAVKKKATPCGHPIAATCNNCGVCRTCSTNLSREVLAGRQQVSHLTLSLGQSTAREEQLRQYISSEQYRPQERTERDLSIARIALLRRRLELAILTPGSGVDIRAVIQEALKMDDLTRTRPIEEVIGEAMSLSKPPPPPKQP